LKDWELKESERSRKVKDRAEGRKIIKGEK